MDHLKKLLDQEEPPGDYYQLLGKPCLLSRREELLDAIRSVTRFLHPYQNHKNRVIVQRARNLQLLAARAEHTFSKDELWKSYDEELLKAIGERFTGQLQSPSPVLDVRQWLKDVCRLAAERLDDAEQFLHRRTLKTESDPAGNPFHIEPELPSIEELAPAHSGDAWPPPLPLDPTEHLPAPPPDAPSLRSLPFRLGNYDVLERLGEGGIGVVYKARHRQLQKLVAIKLLRPDRPIEPNSIARFRREIEAIGKLGHANIVAATDAGEHEGCQFLVMELLDGRNLHEVVQSQGPLPVAEVCQLISQAALGLQHAHERGLVHRDMKPSNLMITRDNLVKVLDLGLAFLNPSPLSRSGDDAAPRSELTATGVILGTIDYMAPEQISERPHVDARTDIYSLGCTMFFMLTGRTPFRDSSQNLLDRMIAHANSPIPALSQYRNDCPAHVEQVLQRMLAKSPAERYQTAAEVASALQAAVRQPLPLPLPVQRQGVPVPAGPPSHRRPPVIPNRPTPPIPSTVSVGAAQIGTPLHGMPAVRSGGPPGSVAPPVRTPPPPPQRGRPAIRPAGAVPTPLVSGSGRRVAMDLRRVIPPQPGAGPTGTSHALLWWFTGAVLGITLLGAIWLAVLSLSSGRRSGSPGNTSSQRVEQRPADASAESGHPLRRQTTTASGALS